MRMDVSADVTRESTPVEDSFGTRPLDTSLRNATFVAPEMSRPASRDSIDSSGRIVLGSEPLGQENLFGKNSSLSKA